MATVYYVVPIFGCVDPQPLAGPYASWEEMLPHAQAIYREQDPGEDAIFYLALADGRPELGAFSDTDLGAEADDDTDDGDMDDDDMDDDEDV